MEATKYTVTIEIEVLSLDSVQAMLNKVSIEMDQEVNEGELKMRDGDRVSWEVDSKSVEF